MRRMSALALTLIVAGNALPFFADEPDPATAPGQPDRNQEPVVAISGVQVGSRPFFLVADMDDGALKNALERCAGGPFHRTDFSIGHRGAPLQFPEHTKESYVAAARQGAGILECDVTFTKDLELVCRHSQCDLHTTTNILVTELAKKCAEPFQPADPVSGESASALCCTSDVTLAEFKTLCGKMDDANPAATTPEEYLQSRPGWRSGLYPTCGTLISHAESIELFRSLGARFAPELKPASVEMPFNGFTQDAYAQKLIDEYVEAGVDPSRVWAQSFDPRDVLYWIENASEFGAQAVFLDGRYDLDPQAPGTWTPGMEAIAAQGVKIIAPPMWMLVSTSPSGEIVPSEYAKAARAAGLDIITWTLERSGPLAGGGGWYYQTTNAVIDKDGDTMIMLDVLAKQVGIRGIFSDWPGTVTYYANCMGL